MILNHDKRFSILLACEELHMMCNGSADYDEDRFLQLRDGLIGRLGIWKPSLFENALYDELVRRLILQVLAEAALKQFYLDQEEHRQIMREQESNYNADIKASIERIERSRYK